MLQVFPQFENLATLTHSVSNFTPCPDSLFNHVKGVDREVVDFLPLMVDKIQKCIDKNIDYKYTFNKLERIVDSKTLKHWHTWLLTNCDSFCLEEYYSCQGDTLIPNYMFSGQSLLNPTPTTEESVRECLNNMIIQTKRRANKIFELSLAS